jgi:hypothetical protein
MPLYMTEQKVLVIKTFYSSGGSCVTVGRQSSDHVAQSGDTIYWIIKQSEETGSVCDNVRRDVNSFVLHLHKVYELWAHHMENV